MNSPSDLTSSFESEFRCTNREVVIFRLISTSTGQDAVLGSIEYLSYTLYHFLASSRARQILRKKSSEPLKGRPSCILAISSLASEARYTCRLFGLIRLLNLALGINQVPRDRWIRTLEFLQVFTLVLYQALENVSYMAIKGVIPKHLIEKYGCIGKWHLWSARFLLGHTVLQFLKLKRDYVLSRRVRGSCLDLREMNNLSENPRKYELRKRKQGHETILEDREWWKGLTSGIMWTPLCVHWSVEGGIGIPADVVGLLSFVAGAWGLRDLWKQTRDL